MGLGRRVLTLVTCCCSLAVAVVSFFAIWTPLGGFLVGVFSDSLAWRLIASAAVLLALGSAAVLLVRAVRATLRDEGLLRLGEDGQIGIESGALVSTAKRAAASVSDVQIGDVDIDLVQHRGEPALAVRMSAVASEDEPIMTCARSIQRAVKDALEAFTEHRVTRVALDFVEPRRRPEHPGPKSPAAEVAASPAPAPDGTGAPSEDRRDEAADAFPTAETPCDDSAHPAPRPWPADMTNEEVSHD